MEEPDDALTPTTTLTILPSHLSLVHVPLDEMNLYMHSILGTWWFQHQYSSTRTRRNPFFALCRNQLELSMFASVKTVKRTFGAHLNLDSTEKSKGKGKEKEVNSHGGVMISEHPWIALEICVAVNGIEEAGHRIHTLTSPLAALSISILFLSTFSSDYILVRAKDLSTVIQVLQGEGFAFNEDEDDLDVVDAFDGAGGSGDDDEDEVLESLKGSFDSIQLNSTSPHHHQQQHPLSRSLSLSLQRSRSNSSSPNISRRNSSQSTSNKPPHLSSEPESALPPSSSTPRPIPPPPPPKLSRLSSPSQRLINLGLSLDPIHQEIWRKKLLQLLFYPTTLVPHPSESSTRTSSRERRRSRSRTATTVERASEAADERETKQKGGIYISIVETSDSISLTSDLEILRKLFDDSGGGGGGGEEMVFVSGRGGLQGEWDREDEESEVEKEEDRTDSESQLESEQERETNLEEEGWENVIEDTQNRGGVSDSEGGEGFDDDDEICSTGGGRTLLECLQIDLLSLGLDASGLAHHYAAVLIEGGVKNFMLQSTFGSANLLVSKQEARRAEKLLLSQSSH